MSVFKCKMCGGSLNISGYESTAICEYCGTLQTLPRLSDEKKANLYDRANHFRRNNDYDKAMEIYNKILNEDNTDAEAYWSLVLCKYGIEYVEDPATHKRVPTCNRTQYTPIYADQDYLAAVKNADASQKKIFEAEAQAIDELQKGILAISRNEKPYDIFICYKEADDQGRRTPDSVLAQEMYYQLTKEGYKVFFSRISLEDKFGSAYEPYIFAALNSAKVMIVVSTKKEYVEAVWVKNEWSRFLRLLSTDNSKVLIPAYKDMDPYDLPEEFSYLQALDMSKLGFMQDLLHGISKMIVKQSNASSTGDSNNLVNSVSNVEPLLGRVELFLEDGDWERADEYCEKVLDIDPKNPYAYIGKLLIEFKFKDLEEARAYEKGTWKDSLNYEKVIRFADPDLKHNIEQVTEEQEEHVQEYREKERIESIYLSAKGLLSKASREDDYYSIIDTLEDIRGYKDADDLISTCERKIVEIEEKRRENQELFKRHEEENRIVGAYQASIKRISIIIIMYIIANLIFLSSKTFEVKIGNTIPAINVLSMFDWYYWLLCLYMQARCIKESRYINLTVYIYALGFMINVFFIIFDRSFVFQSIWYGAFAGYLNHTYKKSGVGIVYGSKKPKLKVIIVFIIYIVVGTILWGVYKP